MKNKIRNCEDCKTTSLSKVAKRCAVCEHKRRSLVLKGKQPPGGFLKGTVPWTTGKKFLYKSRPKMKGKIAWNKGKKGVMPVAWNKGMKGLQVAWNRGTKGLMPTPWNKGIKRPELSGEKHPSWKGGLTSKNQKIRNSFEYKLWRTAIFERDDYTCQDCCQRGGKLQADHIKPFSLFPELRLAIDNGRTLCIPCHKKTPTYSFNVMKFNRENFTETV